MLIPVIKTPVIHRALSYCSCFLIDVTVIFTVERNVSVANGETLFLSLLLCHSMTHSRHLRGIMQWIFLQMQLGMWVLDSWLVCWLGPTLSLSMFQCSERQWWVSKRLLLHEASSLRVVACLLSCVSPSLCHRSTVGFSEPQQIVHIPTDFIWRVEPESENLHVLCLWCESIYVTKYAGSCWDKKNNNSNLLWHWGKNYQRHRMWRNIHNLGLLAYLFCVPFSSC